MLLFVPLVQPLVRSTPTLWWQGWHVAEVSAIPLLARRMTSLSVARWRATKLRSAPVFDRALRILIRARGGDRRRRHSRFSIPLLIRPASSERSHLTAPAMSDFNVHRSVLTRWEQLHHLPAAGPGREREGQSPPAGQRTPILREKRLLGMSL